MILSIVAYGDPVLRKKAEEIPENYPDLKQLVEDMFQTMYNADGVGLAAPQIGKSLRVFVVDAHPMDDEALKDFKRVFINPIVVEESGDPWGYEEGCLSIPGLRAEVLRPSSITLTYRNENWEEQTETFTGLGARVVQHELDHLNGVLFTDHLTPLKKRLIKNKLLEITKGITNAKYRMKFASAGAK
jgi:peptide deformylase